MMNRKKRVLFLSEASYLSTGYAMYSKNILDIMHKTGKYDLAEFSVYGGEDDPRRKTIKWKNYPNLPDQNQKEYLDVYNSNIMHQFGAWRFERACLDFEPDIVLCIRDFWMDSFVYHSPFRRIFNWCWMPTVDARPQNEEWISVFSDADYVLTYSDFAYNVLKEQAKDRINLCGVASPSASKEFKPIDKKLAREKFNLPDDIKIIGTVMRNQRRKLFPTLLESFSTFIKETNDKNTFLLCHTSFPDSGWNLSELLHKYGISSRVLMTYTCTECKNIDICFFHDARKLCLKCLNTKFTSLPSGVTNGVSDENLAYIYNIMDLYVQCANSEGFGLPQVEAAACGIPIACTNYSAMEDIVNKLDAYPIELSDLYQELETGCLRAVPSKASLVSIFKQFFSLTDEERIQKSKKVLDCYQTNYSWHQSAQQWMKVIDKCQFSDWKQAPLIYPNNDIGVDQKTNTDFMRDVCNNYIYTQSQKNSFFVQNMHRDLNRGYTKTSYEPYIVSEFALNSDKKNKPLTRTIAKDFFKARMHNYNVWETLRIDRSKLKEESWLNQ